MVESIQGAGARAIAEAEAKGQKVTAADRIAAKKLDTDNTKWAAQKLLTEYQGLEDGGGQVTVKLVGVPGAAPEPAGTPGKAYVPPGQPVLKIVGAPASVPTQLIAQEPEQGNG